MSWLKELLSGSAVIRRLPSGPPGLHPPQAAVPHQPPPRSNLPPGARPVMAKRPPYQPGPPAQVRQPSLDVFLSLCSTSSVCASLPLQPHMAHLARIIPVAERPGAVLAALHVLRCCAMPLMRLGNEQERKLHSGGPSICHQSH